MTVSQLTDYSIYTQSVSAAETSQSSEQTSETALGQQDFLTLLVAQMENQDPLDPMDSTDYTAQLAQYSMLEQQLTTNSWLSQISETLNTNSDDTYLDYVGKEVLTDTGTLSVISGSTQDIRVSLDQDAATVQMVIYDSDGDEIACMDLGPMNAGVHEVSWDATDSTGNTVDDGPYTYGVIATDAGNKTISVETAEISRVDGISYETDPPCLLAGGALINPATITAVQLDENNG